MKKTTYTYQITNLPKEHSDITLFNELISDYEKYSVNDYHTATDILKILRDKIEDRIKSRESCKKIDLNTNESPKDRK